MAKNNMEKRIHFIGVGGVSMSALATESLTHGIVSGSDIHYNPLMDKLRRKGAFVYEGSDAAAVIAADLVVYNSAIKDDDAELMSAISHNVPLMTRSEYLGRVAKTCKACIAVGGIHGKSTTTALIASALKEAECKFTAHIGAEAVDLDGNYYSDGRDFFVTEACEYKGNFLSLSPDIEIILNVEMDHPDYYENEERVYAAFSQFAKKIKKGGVLIINADEKYSGLYKDLKDISVVTFGIGKGIYSAHNIRQAEGKYIFDLHIGGAFSREVKSNLYGKHNIYNILACIAASDCSGAGIDAACRAAQSFGGVKRRLELIGNIGACSVISDYAHHPSEIRAAIASARGIFKGKIMACFQPHTYSRTAKLFDDFRQCFGGADFAVIVKEYPAREAPCMGKNAYELFAAVERPESDYAESLDVLNGIIKNKAPQYGCILLLGAGDIGLFKDIVDAPSF
ncbi:MAG: UDP-N-acetylmuramate--L-alanine ligase [Clostridiales bacterium]|jgi:UDP-N-acetylmuramate--alanine ligase|nr:UDP-N-acetylmuramate--L-alanine ligase [Clostridiales bacterium]